MVPFISKKIKENQFKLKKETSQCTPCQNKSCSSFKFEEKKEHFFMQGNYFFPKDKAFF